MTAPKPSSYERRLKRAAEETCRENTKRLYPESFGYAGPPAEVIHACTSDNPCSALSLRGHLDRKSFNVIQATASVRSLLAKQNEELRLINRALYDGLPRDENMQTSFRCFMDRYCGTTEEQRVRMQMLQDYLLDIYYCRGVPLPDADVLCVERVKLCKEAEGSLYQKAVEARKFRNRGELRRHVEEASSETALDIVKAALPEGSECDFAGRPTIDGPHTCLSTKCFVRVLQEARQALPAGVEVAQLSLVKK